VFIIFHIQSGETQILELEVQPQSYFIFSAVLHRTRLEFHFTRTYKTK